MILDLDSVTTISGTKYNYLIKITDTSLAVPVVYYLIQMAVINDPPYFTIGIWHTLIDQINEQVTFRINQLTDIFDPEGRTMVLSFDGIMPPWVNDFEVYPMWYFVAIPDSLYQFG